MCRGEWPDLHVVCELASLCFCTRLEALHRNTFHDILVGQQAVTISPAVLSKTTTFFFRGISSGRVAPPSIMEGRHGLLYVVVQSVSGSTC